MVPVPFPVMCRTEGDVGFGVGPRSEEGLADG